MPFDDLTQLYNRREMFTRLKQEMARSDRSQVPFSVLMIDVDHFKEVNDNFGHLRGDSVLREIAHIIKENCRRMDTACRYGGDEFVVIIPETDRWSVEKAAERLLRKLGSHHFVGNDEQPDLNMTVSIGTATYENDCETAELLLTKADEALYLAKRSGRNRVAKDIDIIEVQKEPVLNFDCFVNRKEELASLKKQFNATLKEKGNLVIISGEAGIGKTRLIEELKRYGRLHKSSFFSAKPFEFGVTPPYHIFFQVIKSYIKEVGREHIQLFRALQPVYKAELVKYIPELISTVSTKEEPSKLSPEYEKMRLFDAIYQIFRVMTSRSPLFIFLDDVQWACEADFELLGYLVRNISDLPVLICCAYRVEEIGEKHPLTQFLRAMSREHRFEKIELQGLGFNDISRLLNMILGSGTPEKIAEMLHRETNGNPFYVEEIIRSFVEDGTVYRDNSRWRFKDVEKIALPSSVEDLLRRRFEGVDQELKDLLTLASVIGNQFQLSLLQRLTDKNEGYLLDLLDLGIKHLLIEGKPDDSYSFTNILLQRTFYENLSAIKRHKIHLQIAQTLKKLHVDRPTEIYESLAHHYLLAEEWAFAFDYNLKAAEKLQGLYANQDAIARYRICLAIMKRNKLSNPEAEKQIHQGLADINYLMGDYQKAIEYYRVLLDRDDLSVEDRSRVLLSLGTVCQKIGDFDNALACYNDGKKLLDETKHKFEIAKLEAASVWIHIKRGEYEKAFRTADSALDVFKAEESDEDIAALYNSLGTVYLDRGDWDKASQCYHRSLDYREKIGDKYNIAVSLNSLGNVYLRLSEFDKAIEYHTKALKMREKIGDKFGIASSYNNLAIVYDNLGEWDKCVDYHHNSLRISKSLVNPHSVALSYSNLAYIILKMGDFDKSIEYSLQSLDIAKRIGDLSHTASVHNNLANAYIGAGKLDEAVKMLEEADKIIAKCDFKNLLTENHCLYADIYLSRNKLDDAEKYARSALDVAQKIKDKGAESEAYCILGRIYFAQNKYDEAVAEFIKGLELSTAIKNDYIRARCLYLLGITMAKKGDDGTSKKYLNEARSIFEQLGSKIYLELVDSAL